MSCDIISRFFIIIMFIIMIISDEINVTKHNIEKLLGLDRECSY